MTIEFDQVTKRYRSTVAVESLSCTIPAGAVTGLLGPNGAGKSTAMRVLAGLERPTAGRATIAGHAYTNRIAPLREVGMMLDSAALHPGRRCVEHLRWLAAANRISPRRVTQVLETTGLADLQRRRGRELSLGMRQRLGLAAALLGDPGVLVLDEPADGLDPVGIAWLRTLLADLAEQGRTILVSSHLLDEVARYADRLMLLAAGRLIADLPANRLAEHPAAPVILRIQSEDPARCAALLAARPGAQVATTAEPALIEARGLTETQVTDLCAAHGLKAPRVTRRPPTLEEFYLALTGQPPQPAPIPAAHSRFSPRTGRTSEGQRA